jgi:hypothetical protein
MVVLLTMFAAASKTVRECRLVTHANASSALTAMPIGASPNTHRLTSRVRRSMIENEFLW